MNRAIIISSAMLLVGCLPQEKNQIIVDGEATIEREPDFFTLSASIRARKDSQSEALADISKKLAKIREDLPQLERLTHLSIDASEAVLRPIQDPECLEKIRYGYDEDCQVIAHFGSINVSVKGSPARQSGYVLSLLSELDAERVSLSGYSLADPESARQDAIDEAVKNARRKASAIAAASDATLAGPIRIQYGEGFPDPRRYGEVMVRQATLEEIAVTGSRVVQPETELDLEPQPIKISEKIVAAFEIE